jgi:hypothetical protein
VFGAIVEDGIAYYSHWTISVLDLNIECTGFDVTACFQQDTETLAASDLEEAGVVRLCI